MGRWDSNLEKLKTKEKEAISFEMTEERRQRWKFCANTILVFLMKNTEGPVEAVAVLDFLLESINQTYKIEYGGHKLFSDKGDS